MKTPLHAALDIGADNLREVETKKARRIMVVDDDFAMRQLIIEGLSDAGYDVDDAENGVRAWKAIHLKDYDLMITDNSMPEMTGIQLIQKLRSAGFELPVILASGSVPADLKDKTPDLKVSAVLPKPFVLGELIQVVKELFNNPSVQAA